jgi:16S rRNA (guanine966-N2)-methyltransferase
MLILCWKCPLRVISGKYKGHALTSFKADHIRPTTDFVKETMFNIIAFHLDEAKVLDLFSGTGSLGIEALSRGVNHVHFVDSHPKSISILKSNLEKLKITEDYKITKTEVIKFLKSRITDEEIILIDPPFTEKMAESVMMALAENIGPNVKFVCIESVKNEPMADNYGELVLWKRKNYGDKLLSVFKLNQPEVD